MSIDIGIIMTIALSLIVGFVVGLLVYRNNVKTAKAAEAKAQAELAVIATQAKKDAAMATATVTEMVNQAKTSAGTSAADLAAVANQARKDAAIAAKIVDGVLKL